MSKVLLVFGTDAPEERIGRMRSSLSRLAFPGTEVEVIGMPGGPPDMEHYVLEHHAVSLMLERVPSRVRAGGFDAVVINCFYDPGVRELRELLEIPVVGVAEASMHLASQLGHRFSVIVGSKKCIPQMSDNALVHGFDRSVASWRAIDFTVQRLMTAPTETLEPLIREADAAVREDMAEVIILGCTAMENAAQKVSERIGVPVVDPAAAGFKTAEMLGDLRSRTGLTISKAYDYQPRGTC